MIHRSTTISQKTSQSAAVIIAVLAADARSGHRKSVASKEYPPSPPLPALLDPSRLTTVLKVLPL